MRFLRSRQGLSLQKMADELGVKRGKLAAYEEKADARPEFYQLLTDKYKVDLNKFLLIEMNNDNYSSFLIKSEVVNGKSTQNLVGEIGQKVTIAELLNQLRSTHDLEEKNVLIDRLSVMIARIEDEKQEIIDRSIQIMQNFVK